MASRTVRSIERILKLIKNRSLAAAVERSVTIESSAKQSIAVESSAKQSITIEPSVKPSIKPHASDTHSSGSKHRTRVAHRRNASQQKPSNQTIDLNKEPWFEDGTGDETLVNAFKPPIDYFYLPDFDADEILVDDNAQSSDLSDQWSDLSDNECANQTDDQPIMSSSSQPIPIVQDQSHHLSITIDKSRRSFDDDEEDDDDRMHLLFGLAMLPLSQLHSVCEADEEDDDESSSYQSNNYQSGYQSTNVSSTTTSPTSSPQLSPYVPALNSSYSPSSRSTTSSLSPSFSSHSFTRSPLQSSSRCDSSSSDSDNETSERTKRLRNRFVRSRSFNQSPGGAVDKEIAENALHSRLFNVVTLDGELEVTSDMMQDLDSWRYLGSFLVKTPRVSSLKIRGLRIGMAEVKALGQGALQFLQHLELSDNHLNDEVALHAVNLIISASIIQTLRVERNGIKSVAPFAELINKDMQLVHLSLANNALDDGGAAALANAISRHARTDRASMLRIVNVQCNQISPGGVELLNQARNAVDIASPDTPFYVETAGQRPQIRRPDQTSPSTSFLSITTQSQNFFRSILRPSVRPHAERNLIAAMSRLFPSRVIAGSR